MELSAKKDEGEIFRGNDLDSDDDDEEVKK